MWGRLALGRVLWLPVAGLLLAAPAASAGVGVAASKPLPPCGPVHATTLVSEGESRVYQGLVPDRFGNLEGASFGCVPGARPRRLDPPRKEDDRTPWLYPEWIVLRPPWVAYVKNFVELDVGDLELAVVNLRSGKSRDCYVTEWSASNWSYGVRGLVLTGTGSIGFMGVREEGYVVEVLACVGTSLMRLDEGPDIDQRSLRLRGSVMSWSHPGQIRSFRLP